MTHTKWYTLKECWKFRETLGLLSNANFPTVTSVYRPFMVWSISLDFDWIQIGLSPFKVWCDSTQSPWWVLAAWGMGQGGRTCTGGGWVWKEQLMTHQGQTCPMGHWSYALREFSQVILTSALFVDAIVVLTFHEAKEVKWLASSLSLRFKSSLCL